MKFKRVSKGIIKTQSWVLFPSFEVLISKFDDWTVVDAYVRVYKLYLFFEITFKFELKKGGKNGKIEG